MQYKKKCLNEETYLVKEILESEILMEYEQKQIKVLKYKMPLKVQLGDKIIKDDKGLYQHVE